MNRITFIVNPISGTKGKQHIIDLIPSYFDDQTFATAIRMTEYAGHAEELARESAHSGVDIVVAVGGDGTVNEVARGLVQTNTALGIIPCGSGNGLARHLGIPMKATHAMQLLSEMHSIQADYGLIDGHPFFCTAGIGFDAMVSDTFAKAGSRGLSTYIRTTLQVGLKYPGDTYEIIVENDGVKTSIPPTKYWLVTAGNASQYGNNFYIAPNASVTDGKLDVNLWRKYNKLFSPIVCSRLRLHNIDKSRYTNIIRCDKVTISRKKAGPIHWDGDCAQGGKVVSIEIVKGGIKMICNKRKQQ